MSISFLFYVDLRRLPFLTNATHMQLENTIKKMGNLLRVGFGNEGALNIAKRWTLKVHPYRIYLGLNACGKRMNAIIVSVQIKDFYLVNTEIKEDSIVFMNRVAKVVHDCAVTWDGNCKCTLDSLYYSACPP